MNTSSRSSARTWTLLIVSLLVVALIAAFVVIKLIPEKRTISELFDQPISRAELIEYPFGENLETVSRTTFTDPEIINRLAQPFKDMPVTGFSGDIDSLHGKTVTNVRFYPDNGDPIDTMMIFIDNKESVVVWADGTANSSTWGRPYDGMFDDYGVTEDVAFVQSFFMEPAN